MSVERQTLIGLQWMGFAKLGGQLLSWVVTLIVLRILVPGDYGLMAIVTIVISVLTNVAEMGLGSSLVQAPKLSRDDVARVTGVVLLLSVAMLLIAIVAAPVAAAVYSDDRLTSLIRVASIQFLLGGLSTVPLSLAHRELQFKRLAWIDIGCITIGGVATLGLAWHGAGVWSLVLGSLAQSTVRTVILLRGNFEWPVFAYKGTRRFVSFGGQVTISRMVWQLVYQADVLIGGRLLTSSALGVYSVSFHLATLPMQKIMGIINQVAFPAVAKLQDEPVRLRGRMIEATRLITRLSIPVMWGMSVVAPELVLGVLGEKWEDGAFPLQIICLVVPLRMVNAIFSTSMFGIGRADIELANSIVSALVLPALFYAGAQWGADGLALSWLIAIPIVTLANLPRMLRAIGLQVGDVLRSVWPSLIAGVGMYTVVVIVRTRLVFLSEIERLPLLVGIGAATFLGLTLLVDRSVRSDMERLVSAVRRGNQ